MSRILNRKNILFLLVLIVLSTIIFSCLNTEKSTSLLSFITKSEENENINSTELETLTIVGFETEYTFDSKVNSYDIDIFENTYYLNIRAVPKSENAVVEILDNKYFENNSGTVIVKVTNNNQTNSYLINWTKKSILSFSKEFDYTGNIQTFTPKIAGLYKLEVWGAQGGNAQYNNYFYGGYGGYSVGYYQLTTEKLYVVVGGRGQTSVKGSFSNNTGYNGGGYGTYTDNSAYGGGGGATHIATSNGLLTALSSDKSSIIIVAGGGGGAASYAWESNYSGTGGAGGGYIGGQGITATSTCYVYGRGGTQTGVQSVAACSNYNMSEYSERSYDVKGGFGTGYSWSAAKTGGSE